MTEPSSTAATCTVAGPAKFVEMAGGQAAICQAVAAAVASGTPGAHRIALDIPSGDRMAAKVTLADGRQLAELRMGISDGRLNRSIVDRFAQDIVNQIASTLGQHQH